MHVLIVPSWYPTTETPLYGIYFAEQARCLADHGLKVGVVYPEQQSLRHLSWQRLRAKHFQTEWSREDGIPTLRRYGWNVWSRFPPGQRCRVRSAVQLADQYVERYGIPDLLHAQSGRWAGAAAARIGHRYDVPYVLHEHFTGFQRDAIFPWRWPVVCEGYRHADAIATVSTPLRNAIASQGLATSSNIDLHPNLAPTSYFHPPPTSRPPPPPLHLVTIAHLSPRKNIEGLINAFARAPLSAAASLTVVGGGPERSRLEAQAGRLGLDETVQFLGQLDRSGVREALWNAHAFVLPSHQETFGVVILEAMATGLPVVATACGGPEDIVTPDTGRLVAPDDVDAIAEALAMLQNEWTSFNPDAIRAYVHDQYGPDSFVRRTQALYQRALERHE